MFQINEDLSIYITRGDSAVFSVSSDGERKFQPDDVVRFTIYAKKNCNDVVLQKDVEVSEETDRVDFLLTESDTKIGNVISKPTDYWYEVELNPFTNPQTIIGYDDDGAKIFKLFPEGADASDIEIEDIPIIDDDFSPTSERPLANYVITRKISELESKVASTEEKITSKDMIPVTSAEMEELLKLGTWKKNTAYLVIDEEEKTDDAYEVANEALAKSKEVLDVANEAFEKANNALIIANSFSLEAKEGGTYTGVGTLSGNPLMRIIEGKGGGFLIIKSDSSVPCFVTPWGTLMPSANDSTWYEKVYYSGNTLWITNTSTTKEHPLDKKGVVYTYYHL